MPIAVKVMHFIQEKGIICFSWRLPFTVGTNLKRSPTGTEATKLMAKRSNDNCMPVASNALSSHSE